MFDFDQLIKYKNIIRIGNCLFNRYTWNTLDNLIRHKNHSWGICNVYPVDDSNVLCVNISAKANLPLYHHQHRETPECHVITRANLLTHWGRVTHICVGKLSIIGSDNGLPPGQRQAIIWTNGGILLMQNLGTNFSETLSEIYTFSFNKMRLKVPSSKWRPFCLGLNVLHNKYIKYISLKLWKKSNKIYTAIYLGCFAGNPWCH